MRRSSDASRFVRCWRVASSVTLALMTGSAVILDYQKQNTRRFPRLNRMAILHAVVLLPMYYAALVPSLSGLSMSDLSMTWDEGQSWLRGGSVMFRVHPWEVLIDNSTRHRMLFIFFAIVV